MARQGRSHNFAEHGRRCELRLADGSVLSWTLVDDPRHHRPPVECGPVTMSDGSRRLLATHDGPAAPVGAVPKCRWGTPRRLSDAALGRRVSYVSSERWNSYCKCEIPPLDPVSASRSGPGRQG